MTAREYLSETFKLRSRMIALKRREEELRTEAEGLRAIVYEKDKVQTSVMNKFDAIMADLVEVQLQYGRAMQECMKGIAVREKQIATLPAWQAEVLRLRYLEDIGGRQLTWGQIIKRVPYSRKQVFRLHSEALKEFERLFKDDTK